MRHRTAVETESSKTIRFEKESVMYFTSVHDSEVIGDSKTATNVESSGDTDVNQHESAEKDQPRDNSISSAKRVFSKSHDDAEREAIIQMRQNENASSPRKENFSYSLNNCKENTKKRCDDLKKKRNFALS